MKYKVKGECRLDEIKKKIDENKNDKNVYKQYIKSFCDSEKAKELFKSNEEFKNVKKQFEVKEDTFDD